MKVLIALSGGVDSAIATYILKQKGFEVIGITLKMYNNIDYIKEAKKIASFLGIKWYWFDYTKDFYRTVVEYFYQTYKNGKTPNPCAYCNKHVKFKFLLDKLKEFNCDMLATGHYAQTKIINNTKLIAKSKNTEKDQSYFLSLLDKNQIKQIYFPLGEIDSKDNVREMAKDIGLPVALKRDSFEICFVKDNYRDLLKKRYQNSPVGYFILNGKKIKKHKGIFNYTVGQRKGIEIPHKEALYISKIDPVNFNITLSTRDAMYKHFVMVEKNNVLYIPTNRFNAKAKLRSKMSERPCKVVVKKDHFILEFEKPQFAPTPGQIAAVYLEDAIILSGFIKSSF